jgi:hypothetical protein
LAKRFFGWIVIPFVRHTKLPFPAMIAVAAFERLIARAEPAILIQALG